MKRSPNINWKLIEEMFGPEELWKDKMPKRETFEIWLDEEGGDAHVGTPDQIETMRKLGMITPVTKRLTVMHEATAEEAAIELNRLLSEMGEGIEDS